MTKQILTFPCDVKGATMTQALSVGGIRMSGLLHLFSFSLLTLLFTHSPILGEKVSFRQNVLYYHTVYSRRLRRHPVPQSAPKTLTNPVALHPLYNMTEICDKVYRKCNYCEKRDNQIHHWEHTDGCKQNPSTLCKETKEKLVFLDWYCTTKCAQA